MKILRWLLKLGALALSFFVLASAVQAVIMALTPLRDFLADGHFIFLAKVEKIYPQKPGMLLAVAEDLKGKAPFRKLAVNLTGDSEGQKTRDTERLLKRLAEDSSLLLFTNQRGKRYTVFAFSNGTWFQVIGQKTGDTVAWGFTHLEPYLRRTFKGTTAELHQVLRAGLAGKKPPPEPDVKEPPGLGPEIGPEKKTGSKPGPTGAGNGSHIWAVIPTLGVGGPLAILALLFPSLFGGVLVLFRQWSAFFAVISLVSLAYLCHWLFGAQFRGSWWVSPEGMGVILVVVTFLGALWSWRRNWAALARGQFSLPPQRTENVVLWITSLMCLALVLFYRQEPLAALDWDLLLSFSGGIWAATLYKVYRGWLRPGSSGLPLPTEGIILWSVLFVLGGLAAARTGTGQVAGEAEADQDAATVKFVGKLWDFQARERGCVVSAPLVTDDRVYFASAHPTFRAGTLFCLDRTSGKEIWQFIDDGNLKQVFSSPAMAYGKLYIGEGFHDDPNCKLYCIDPQNGEKLWDFQTTSQTESTPFVRKGKVFFGAGNDGLYCLDALTGKKSWQFPPLPQQGRLLRIGSSPLVVVGGRLYVGSGIDRNRKDDPGETALFCLDAASGKLNWKVPTELPSWGAPVLADNQVFFGLGNGDVFEDAPNPAGAMLCVDPASGKILWRTDVPNGVLDRPAVDKSRVFFGARDGHCYCLDRTQGKMIWKTFLGSPVIAPPALARNTGTGKTASVYAIASRGRVCCLDPASGQIQWTYNLERLNPHLSSAPSVVLTRTVAGDRRHIYFGAALDNPTSGRAVLYCLEDFMAFPLEAREKKAGDQ